MFVWQGQNSVFMFTKAVKMGVGDPLSSDRMLDAPWAQIACQANIKITTTSPKVCQARGRAHTICDGHCLWSIFSGRAGRFTLQPWWHRQRAHNGRSSVKEIIWVCPVGLVRDATLSVARQAFMPLQMRNLGGGSWKKNCIFFLR